MNWDFRTFLEVEAVMAGDMTEEEQGIAVLELFYGVIPMGIEEATAAMLWFMRCGKEEKPRKQSKRSESEDREPEPKRPDFSYELDSSLIYAAFLEQYKIDLTVETLHWWKFRALFDALKPDHMFTEVRKCRSIKITKDMSKETKAYYRAMKKLYALPIPEQTGIDEVTAALMGDGNVMGVLNDEES